MMKRRVTTVLATAGLVLSAASAALAADPLPKCSPDARVSGTTCMDTFEASVWRIPLRKENKELISKVRRGKATVADLTAAGATRLGVASDDYAPCDDHGSGCTDIFAVSVPGETPSAYITQFQAQQACSNPRKRLPLNTEWQAAVAGTPDPGPDNGTTDCNTASISVAPGDFPPDPLPPGAVKPTGSRSSCVSAVGVFDLVGNLYEWVADWVPLATLRDDGTCAGSWSESRDDQCLAGANTTRSTDGVLETGALLRGGGFIVNFNGGEAAGPLNVSAAGGPSTSSNNIGFRCATDPR